jgi:hypothetical protein
LPPEGAAGTTPLLSVPRAGYDASEINAGCCGMAGLFGYERYITMYR